MCAIDLRAVASAVSSSYSVSYVFLQDYEKRSQLTSVRPRVCSNSSKNALVLSSTLATSALVGFFAAIPSGVRSGSSTPFKHRMHRMTALGSSKRAKPKACGLPFAPETRLSSCSGPHVCTSAVYTVLQGANMFTHIQQILEHVVRDPRRYPAQKDRCRLDRLVAP